MGALGCWGLGGVFGEFVTKEDALSPSPGSGVSPTAQVYAWKKGFQDHVYVIGIARAIEYRVEMFLRNAAEAPVAQLHQDRHDDEVHQRDDCPNCDQKCKTKQQNP